MKRTLLLALCLATAMEVAATDWYVNADNYGRSGMSGRTEELAYGTIQEAINVAANEDTIYVAPGVYSNGLGACVSSWGKSRIGWNNKKLFIYSTGGAAVTHIVGEKAPEPTNEVGTGPDAVRCVAIYGDSSKGTIFKGFTFRDGATVSDKSEGSGFQPNSEQGGAVCVGSAEIYFADCVFTKCSGYNYSVANNGTFVRCLFTRNVGRRGGMIISGNGAKARLYACVVHHNYNGVNRVLTNGILLYNLIAVNCTVVDNCYASCCYSANESFYNTVFFGTGARSANCTYVNCVTDATEKHPIMSTIHPDVRLLPNSAALTAGDGEHLALIPLPEAVGYEDYGGNIPATSGTIAAGATQTVCTPAAGGIATVGYWVNIDGSGLCRESAYSYAFPDAYPTQYLFKVTAPAGKRLAYFQFNANYGAPNFDYRFPTVNDELLVMPPADPSVIITNNDTQVKPICYVKPDADATQADGTEEHPYRTLQAAADATHGSSVIMAKAGVYAEGVSEHATYGRSRLLTQNVMRITSEEGAERTVIMGEADTSADGDAYGRGPNAVRCIAHIGNMLQLQGFTLTGGRTGTGNNARGQGGAAYGNSYLYIDDCIVTNNCAKECGVAHNAQLKRSYLAGNHATDFIFSLGSICACVVENNTVEHPDNGIIGSDSRIVHSVIIGERASSKHPYGTSATIRRYASVFIGGDTARANGTSAGNVCWDFMKVNDANALVADPLLADPANGDWHPFAASPVFTAGVVPEYANYGNGYWFYATTDYEGNRITFNGGRPVAGAFMKPTSRRIVAVSAPNGGFSPATERVELGESETYSVSHVDGATRPLVGVVVNGVTNDLSSGSWSRSITGVEAAGGFPVVALYSSDWYAAPDGDDEANGFFPSTAKTLKGALENAGLRSGDRVLALPGVYATGEMLQDNACVIKARAVVPGGVTLESTGGRDVTFIRGAAATVLDNPPIVDHPEYPLNGMGADAIRCVYLRAGSKLKGFTLTDGHTRALLNGTTANHTSADTTGAGVGAAGSDRVMSWVEDCAISNCVAFRAGGVMAAYCNRCIFEGNYASYIGGATSDSCVYNSISRGNKVGDSRANLTTSGFAYSYTIDACTVLDGVAFANSNSVCRNTLVLGCFDAYATTTRNVTNCVFNANNSSLNAAWLEATPGATVTNAAAFALDDDGRPIIGESIAIDAADPMPGDCPTEFDLTGVQRVYNGAADIGALEADWRSRYTRDIARSSRFAVTNAGPQVTESAQGTVRLAPGESVLAAWTGLTGRSVKTVLTVRVTGTGALTVTLDDGTVIDEVTSADGDRDLTFNVPSEGCGLNFSYARTDGDTGYAELLGSEVFTGTALKFR